MIIITSTGTALAVQPGANLNGLVIKELVFGTADAMAAFNDAAAFQQWMMDTLMTRFVLNNDRPDTNIDAIYYALEAQLAATLAEQESVRRAPYHSAKIVNDLGKAASALRHAICCISEVVKTPPTTAPAHGLRYGHWNGQPVTPPPGFELVPEGECPPDSHLRLMARNREIGDLWTPYIFRSRPLPAKVYGGFDADGKPNETWVIAFARRVKS